MAVRGAYKYVSEPMRISFQRHHGLNVDAGIFVSYIACQLLQLRQHGPINRHSSLRYSVVFNGVRIPVVPTNKLKIEPWIINGWQSYNVPTAINGSASILYRPAEWAFDGLQQLR